MVGVHSPEAKQIYVTRIYLSLQLQQVKINLVNMLDVHNLLRTTAAFVLFCSAVCVPPYMFEVEGTTATTKYQKNKIIMFKNELHDKLIYVLN